MCSLLVGPRHDQNDQVQPASDAFYVYIIINYELYDWKIFILKILYVHISHPWKCKCFKNVSDSGSKKYLQYNDDISLH